MRILIADGQSSVRYALHILLQRQSGIEVVGEAIDAQELLARIEAASPDLVLLDWELPGLPRRALLAAMRNAVPNLTVIALSGRSEDSPLALEAGADAFVSKVEPPERLLSAISLTGFTAAPPG